MNNLQTFNSPDFGEIRAVLIDGEPWFVAKDLSEPLGYTKTANMVKLVDVEDKRTIESSILEPSKKSNSRLTSLINESGLYAAIFGSKQINAKKFKKWVTSEVLPQIRRTGSYDIRALPQSPTEQIKLLAQGHVELKEEIDAVKSDLEELRGDLPILPIEASRITTAVKRRGVAILGGKTSKAYQDRSMRHKLYANLYANLKYNFGVSSYMAIRRNQCDKAIEIIQKYEPPFFLVEQIENFNAQMTLDM